MIDRVQMSQYRYRPFDSTALIRLIDLQPGEWPNPISCTIQNTTPSSDLQYEALSYMWGDLNDTTTINLGDGEITITRSLETALRYLRYEERSRTLWVDALCINQRDI